MDSEIVSNFVRELPEGSEVTCQVGDQTINVSRRELAPELPRHLPDAPIARHPARCHVFEDIHVFIDYLSRWANTNYGLVLFDGEQFAAVLDESQETDREIVYFHPKKSTKIGDTIAWIKEETGLMVGRGTVAHRPWKCREIEPSGLPAEIPLKVDSEGNIEIVD